MKKLISFGLLLLLLTSCSQLKSLGFRSYNNSFMENLKENTAGMSLYRDFTTIAVAKATHFNKQLMREYIEYTQDINLSKEKNKEYEPILKEFNNYDIYWVALYTENDDINSLASKDSFWNVYIACGGKTYFPKAIRTVRSTAFTSQWLYMIHATNWFRQYSIKFKKNNCTNKIVHLVIASYLGNINLTFGKQGYKGGF